MTTTSVSPTGRASGTGAAGPRPAAPAPGARRRKLPGSAQQWTAFGFAAPLLAYLLVFYAYPLWRNVELSLHDYTVRAFVQGNPEFVGFDKYAEVFGSDSFGTAVLNTALFTLVSIALQYSIGLALAVFFRNNFRLSGVLRALFLATGPLFFSINFNCSATMSGVTACSKCLCRVAQCVRKCRALSSRLRGFIFGARSSR